MIFNKCIPCIILFVKILHCNILSTVIGPASCAALFNNRVLGDIFMKGAQTEILNHFQRFKSLGTFVSGAK